MSSLGALLCFLAGTMIMIAACRTNPYCQPQLKVWHGQWVVTWGIYKLVRHPHYLGAIIWLAGPMFLWGRYLALPWMLFCGLYFWRIFKEEAMLTEGLAGYREYMEQTRYRLIPGIF